MSGTLSSKSVGIVAAIAVLAAAGLLLLVEPGPDQPDGSGLQDAGAESESAVEAITPSVGAERDTMQFAPDARPPGESPEAERTRVDGNAAGTLAGRVVDRNGSPLPGAVVTAHTGRPLFQRFDRPDQPERPERPTGVTDPAGRFRISDLSPLERYHLRATLPGFAPEVRSEFAVWSGRTTGVGDLTLANGAIVSGRLVDESGQGIAEAAIQAVFETGEARARSDRTGAFLLADLVAGFIRIRARAEGHMPLEGLTEHRLLLEEGEVRDGLELVMNRAGTIRGQIVSESGVPILGAYVHAYPQTGDSEKSRFSDVTRSDASGSFVMDQVAAGVAHRLTIRHPGYSPAKRERIFADTAPLQVTLHSRPSILVAAVDAITGTPITPDRARFVGADGTELSHARVGSEPGNPHTVRIAYGDPGSYALELFARGYQPAATPVLTTDGRSSYGPFSVPMAAIVLPRAPFVVQIVHGETDRPVPGARIATYVNRAGAQFAIHHGVVTGVPHQNHDIKGETDADGRFTLPKRPADGIILDVLAPGLGRARARVGSLPATSAVRPAVIRLETGGALRGTVFGLDGEPARDWPVVAESPGLAVFQARTDSDGRYRLSPLPAGPYLLAPGNPYARVRSSLSAGADDRQRARPRSRAMVVAGQTGVVDLAITALGASLTGRVTLNGEGRMSLRVALAPDGELEDHSRATTTEAWTGERGDFAFIAIDPGVYLLSVQASSGNPLLERPVTLVGGRNPDLHLDVQTGGIRGDVLSARDGTPITAQVAAHHPGRDGGESRAGFARTASDGSFLIPDLPAGRYRVAARSARYGTLSRSLEVTAGRVTRHRFLFDEPGRAETRLTGPEVPSVPLRVSIHFADGGSVARGWRKPDPDSNAILIEPLAAGRYRVELLEPASQERAEHHGSASFEVRTGETSRISVTMQPVER